MNDKLSWCVKSISDHLFICLKKIQSYFTDGILIHMSNSQWFWTTTNESKLLSIKLHDIRNKYQSNNPHNPILQWINLQK